MVINKRWKDFEKRFYWWIILFQATATIMDCVIALLASGRSHVTLNWNAAMAHLGLHQFPLNSGPQLLTLCPLRSVGTAIVLLLTTLSVIRPLSLSFIFPCKVWLWSELMQRAVRYGDSASASASVSCVSIRFKEYPACTCLLPLDIYLQCCIDEILGRLLICLSVFGGT